MVAQLTSLHVNASAIKRILNLPQSRAIEIRYVGSDLVVVWEKSIGQEVIITRMQFEREFERFRRQGAKECVAQPLKSTPYGESFEVVGKNGDLYQVEISERGIACTCEDWHQHRSTCKHGYAVLDLLGLTSLTQYQQARQVAHLAA